MKYLYISSVLMLSLSVVSYIALFSILGSNELASGVAGLFIVSIPPFADMLNKFTIRSAEQQSSSVRLPEFEDRAIDPVKLLLLGTLMMGVTGSIAGAITGFFIGFAIGVSQSPTPAPLVLVFAQIPLSMILVFWISQWIGQRYASYGLAVCILALLIGKPLFAFLLLTVYPSADEDFGVSEFSGALPVLVDSLIFYLPAALIGFFRGRRNRHALFLKFIIDVLPSNTRLAIQDLAVEEAQRVLTASPRKQP